MPAATRTSRTSRKTKASPTRKNGIAGATSQTLSPPASTPPKTNTASTEAFHTTQAATRTEMRHAVEPANGKR